MDSLTTLKQLTDSGISQRQAKAITRAIGTGHNDLVTKEHFGAYMEHFRTELKYTFLKFYIGIVATILIGQKVVDKYFLP